MTSSPWPSAASTRSPTSSLGPGGGPSWTPSTSYLGTIYTIDSKVYYLTWHEDVHLLTLPERRRRELAANDDDADEASPSVKIKGNLLFEKPPRIDQPPNVLLKVVPKIVNGMLYTYHMNYMAKSKGPHMNARPQSSHCYLRPTSRSTLPMPLLCHTTPYRGSFQPRTWCFARAICTKFGGT
jgi:hypothetical protein